MIGTRVRYDGVRIKDEGTVVYIVPDALGGPTAIVDWDSGSRREIRVSMLHLYGVTDGA